MKTAEEEVINMRNIWNDGNINWLCENENNDSLSSAWRESLNLKALSGKSKKLAAAGAETMKNRSESESVESGVKLEEAEESGGVPTSANGRKRRRNIEASKYHGEEKSGEAGVHLSAAWRRKQAEENQWNNL